MDRIIDEYTTFAQPKPRDCDIQYIAKFEVAEVKHLCLVPLVEHPAIRPEAVFRPLRHVLPAALMILAFLSLLSMNGSVHRHTSDPILPAL